MNKKTKVFTLAGLLVLLILGLQVKNFFESQKQLKEIESIQTQAKEIIASIEELYENNEEGYLDSQVKKSDIEEIEGFISSLSSDHPVPSELQAAYQQLEDHYQSQEGLNSLFQSPYIKGNSIDSEALYIENISSREVKEAKSHYFFNKAQNAFENQINFQFIVIEEEIKAYELAEEILEDLKFIPIRPRNHKLIARSFSQAEDISKKLNNQLLVNRLDKSMDAFINKYKDVTKVQWAELDQAFVIEQLEESERLLEMAKDYYIEMESEELNNE